MNLLDRHAEHDKCDELIASGESPIDRRLLTKMIRPIYADAERRRLNKTMRAMYFILAPKMGAYSSLHLKAKEDRFVPVTFLNPKRTWQEE